MELPNQLYKYRGFNQHTLDMIVNNNVYYTDPSTFNDPLDTQPSLVDNLREGGSHNLLDMLKSLVVRRVIKELDSSDIYGIVGKRGMISQGHDMAKLEEKRLGEIFRKILDSKPPAEDDATYAWSKMPNYIEDELRRRYVKGVVSLSERDNCPLMWSHYGEQHRGICIGYSVTRMDHAVRTIHQVKYGGVRGIRATRVAAMLYNDDIEVIADAEKEVDEKVLLCKAEGWSYEQEWRLLGPRGAKESPLTMNEIIFGLRCEDTVKDTIINVVQAKQPEVTFYVMQEESHTFNLEKVKIPTE